VNWMQRIYDSKYQMDSYRIGIMKLNGKDKYGPTDCNNQNPKDFCDAAKNAKCAEQLYLKSGWNQPFWISEAKACGCLTANNLKI